jgi:hypothetical protein
MVSEDVMNQAGIVPEEDISDVDADAADQEHIPELEEQSLDVFEDFLQNFDLDDLDSGEDDKN